jgi:hypothetical protein
LSEKPDVQDRLLTREHYRQPIDAKTEMPVDGIL